MSSFKIFCVLNQPSTFIFIENKIKKTRNLQRIVTLSLIKMLLVLLKKATEIINLDNKSLFCFTFFVFLAISMVNLSQ